MLAKSVLVTSARIGWLAAVKIQQVASATICMAARIS